MIVQFYDDEPLSRIFDGDIAICDLKATTIIETNKMLGLLGLKAERWRTESFGKQSTLEKTD